MMTDADIETHFRALGTYVCAERPSPDQKTFALVALLAVATELGDMRTRLRRLELSEELRYPR